MKLFLLALAVVVFKTLLKKATPMVRARLKMLLTDFKDYAAETPNKFDDILAETLYDVIIGDELADLNDE